MIKPGIWGFKFEVAWFNESSKSYFRYNEKTFSGILRRTKGLTFFKMMFGKTRQTISALNGIFCSVLESRFEKFPDLMI